MNVNTVVAKGDSAASSHYWREKDTEVLENITLCNGPTVRLPDNTAISANKKAILPLPSTLSEKAKKVNILLKLNSSSLISLGQLCDDDCKVILHKKFLLATKNNKVVLQGYRNISDGLWDIPIAKTSISPRNYPSPPTHAGLYQNSNNTLKPTTCKSTKVKTNFSPLTKMLRPLSNLAEDNAFDNIIEKQKKEDNKHMYKVAKMNPSMSVIIQKKKTHMELAQYLHAACFSPVRSTFLKAIKNNHFQSWPGLTPDLITKHLPTSVATVQGHIHQERQHLQSTLKQKGTSLQEIKKKIRNIEITTKGRRINNGYIEKGYRG